ncbi:hypothetical protein [Aquimarina litoralis]|uniref:hypothetical protein n=1 Tax=Aquimarina litoralis TaxID=584605 RepID=UPI001C599DFA|nr:hypothetical protein [Aquimarina litoralis]MBW1294828.1 hypothetical protein [Aquimarina litoralis]
MKLFGFIILTTFYVNITFCQIGEKDIEKAKKFEHQYAEIIDSTKALTQNSSLIYSHNSLFRCIHLNGTDNKIFTVGIVYLDDFSGYMEFKKDLNEKVLFEVRGDGSGNKPFYIMIDKITGEKKFIDNIKE